MKRLTQYVVLPKNLFLLLFWNISFAFLIIFLLKGMLSFMDYSTVTFNEEPALGLTGFVVNIIIFPIMSLLTSFSLWLLILFGNFILKLVLRIFDL